MLLSPREQEGFLAQLEAESDLRHRVETLLERDRAAVGFLDHSLLRPSFPSYPESAPPAGRPERIGPYRIEARLAIGGTSVVYLARREDEPGGPQLAIKWIRSEWVDATNLPRVMREAGFLARLDHPGIARLLDAGSSDERPFFVMEYVHGAPISEFCDGERLSIQQRLALFQRVCDAVRHAHQNLIVHRDLKPGNILVTARGEPKLLDFGISAVLDPQRLERTATLPLFLTPSYASPEQLAGRGIATSSDVYSLGVLLYELLSGERPFDWTGHSQHEIHEELRQDDAPFASRLHCDARRLRMHALARRTTPDALRRQLRGDLDNILRRAIRFEPRDRYASVEQLAEDIERYLAGHPVRARAATVGYRIGKFVRRHAVAVTNSALAATFLVGFLVQTQSHSRRVETERDLARDAQARAEQQQEMAEEVVAFLVDAFAASDPYESPSPDTTAREILERGVAKLSELPDSPGARATLSATIGRVYLRLGELDQAETLLSDALQLHREAGSETTAEAATLLDLARAEAASGHYDLAGESAQRAVALWRVSDDRDPHGLPGSLRLLASISSQQAHYEAATGLAKEALELCRRRFGDEHEETALAQNTLMEVLYRAGDLKAADPPARRSYELVRSLHGPTSLPASDAANNLGAVLWATGEYEESEELYRSALAIRRRRLPPGHPSIAATLNNLGNLHMNLAHYERAESLLREALEINERSLGAGHPDTMSNRANLANVVSARGDYEAAERLYRETLAKNREIFGEHHPKVTIVMHNLADLVALRGRHEEARDLFVETERLRIEAGEDNSRLTSTQFGLARALHQTGDLERSEAKYEVVLSRFRAELGSQHWRYANAVVHVADLQADRGRLAEAEALAREAIGIYDTTLPARHWRRAVAESILGAIEARQGETEAGERLRRAWNRLRESKGEEATQTREARERLEQWRRPAASQ